MTKAKVILNPYAARWQALKQRPEAEAALHAAGVDFELIVSEYPGHNAELAEGAARQGFNPVIAAGGDSTFNEVVSGIIHAAYDRPVETQYGILPMGTANDLADNLGISKDLEEAARIIAGGYTRLIDVCQVN